MSLHIKDMINFKDVLHYFTSYKKYKRLIKFSDRLNDYFRL